MLVLLLLILVVLLLSSVGDEIDPMACPQRQIITQVSAERPRVWPSLSECLCL